MPSHERWISKFKIKEYSWVFVPTKETIQAGLLIKESLEKVWSAPSCFYHMRSGGHIKALQSHKHNKYFLHLDIKDFFGNINRSRVTRCLKPYFSYDIAREIAIESTVRSPVPNANKYILPFGFVQSPIIASICLSKSALGKYLRTLSKNSDFVVSVYMDDIIISANTRNLLLDALSDIKTKSDRSGFPLNDDKEEGPDSSVTAFNVKLSHEYLEITENKFSALRDKLLASENKFQKQGILSYIFSVNVEQGRTLVDEQQHGLSNKE